MVISLCIAVFVLWLLGMCLTLKLEAVATNQETDYVMLVDPLVWIAWPVVAVLHLRSRHPARSICYSMTNGEPEIRVTSEKWVY